MGLHGWNAQQSRGYKTLTLWTYHPRMNKVMALAIMECQNKNTQMIKHFLQTFNKCLQDYTGIDDYKFDPYGIMCDEGGTNMNAIEVFGKEFMAHKRVVIANGISKAVLGDSYQVLTRMNKKF